MIDFETLYCSKYKHLIGLNFPAAFEYKAN